MKFFVDTAEIDAIRELHELGMVDGVTTNPSLIMKSGRDIKEVTKEICDLVDGPVSAETVATDADGMIDEGRELAKIADNIAIKVPLTWAGLKACKVLTDEGRMVNVTLCFSANQALLAAKVGATFISPFIGRLDDINLDGMELIADIRTVYDNYDYETEILAASIRTVNHVAESAAIGADVITAPPGVIKKLAEHPLTDKGLAAFLADWEKTGTNNSLAAVAHVRHLWLAGHRRTSACGPLAQNACRRGPLGRKTCAQDRPLGPKSGRDIQSHGVAGMTNQAADLDALRTKILHEPEVVLDDHDVMRALVDANEKTLGGNVVDLRGIAMARLEQRLDRLEDTHRSVIAAAYDNLAGTNQVHRAVLAMLDPTDFETFLRNLGEEVASILRVDAVRLVLESEAQQSDAPERLGEILTVVPPGFVETYISLGRSSATPGRHVTLRQICPDSDVVYGQAADWLKSEAILKLDFGRGRLPGMLTLGAEDPHQFKPSQGTDLLAFFAGVFERQMRRWLD